MGCTGAVREALCQGQGQGGQQAAVGAAVQTELCRTDVVSLKLVHKTKQQHRQGGFLLLSMSVQLLISATGSAHTEAHATRCAAAAAKVAGISSSAASASASQVNPEGGCLLCRRSSRSCGPTLQA